VLSELVRLKRSINKRKTLSGQGLKGGLLAKEGLYKILNVVFHVPKDGGGGEPSVGTL